jgi:hypothetical protein
MDYKVVAMHDDGSYEDRYCATDTDVENFVVEHLRKANRVGDKVTNIAVFNLAVD